MKKVLVSVLILFFLAGTAVFADDAFVPITGGDTETEGVATLYGDGEGEDGPIEAYFGFQFSMDFFEGEMAPIPGLAFGARQYFMTMGETGNIHLGWSAMASFGLITSMTWPMLNQETNQIEDTEITWDDADFLLNMGMVVGGTARVAFSDNLGFVGDLGLFFNVDMATWQVHWFNMMLQHIWTDTLDLTAISIGVGANVGFQYRMQMMDRNWLIFEIGANVGATFFRHNVITLTVEHIPSGTSNSVDLAAGASPEGMTVRVAPYFLVGWRF